MIQMGKNYPVMSNHYTKALMEFWIDNTKNEEERNSLKDLLRQMNNQDIFVLWIKLPPCKSLIKNQVKVINLEYGASKENRKDDEIILKMPSGESHSVFYTIKQPVDYDFKKQSIFTIDEKRNNIKIKSWKKTKQNLFYVNETQDSLSITSKPNSLNPIELHYKFKPKFKIISTPLTGIVFLISASIFLLILNDCQINGCIRLPIPENWFSILDRKLEISGAIIGASLVLPRLVTNSSIRHSMLFLYFIPIGLAIYSILM